LPKSGSHSIQLACVYRTSHIIIMKNSNETWTLSRPRKAKPGHVVKSPTEICPVCTPSKRRAHTNVRKHLKNCHNVYLADRRTREYAPEPKQTKAERMKHACWDLNLVDVSAVVPASVDPPRMESSDDDHLLPAAMPISGLQDAASNIPDDLSDLWFPDDLLLAIEF